MKKNVKTFVEFADAGLRGKCDRIPPKCRRMVVLGSLAVFAALAIYMAVRSVFFSGSNRELTEVEHIRQPDFPRQDTEHINHLKPYSHDSEQ